MFKSRRKKFITFFLSLVLMLSFSLVSNFNKVAASPSKAKNVILLIPDGTGITHTTLARWYKGGEPLAMDEIACGLIRTYSSDAVIADSAPAATAMATGYKSHTGFISVLPDVANMPLVEPIKKGEERRPVASILEGAKLNGMATGIVATCELPHATPASFASHYPNRKAYDTLSEQIVYNDVDVLLTGGRDVLVPEKRADKEDMISILQNKGYDIVKNVEELRNTDATKVCGLFAPMALDYEFDRSYEQPSLSTMTQKAIDILSNNKKDGFFLMVEGSKIDWASHANDPVGIISDALAFDDAVSVALNFAKKDKNTVVIVAPDHSNGGMSIGDSALDKTYDNQPLSTIIGPLKKAKLTGEGIGKKLNADRSNIKEVMLAYYGIDDLTTEEEQSIKTCDINKVIDTVGPMISKRAHIGWTTKGHSGEEVGLYVYHPKGIRPTGVIQNTDVNKYMCEVLDINLQDVTDKLFLQAEKAFKEKGATISVDSSDTENLVLVVTKDDTTIKFPQNKNIAIIGDEIIELPGVTVYTGTKENIEIAKWYLSNKAINLIK
ncbi:alkaline phosphatase [Clostridium cochlearium]|uniref:alkaline phosphatase n=1 Tax=Clostridium cochlearium TaxID=1494 RepID=UPI000B94ABD7|nr:alkaline phosphatase [Clostridium cochlearium]MBV1821014.1 alkaline phosphatase [Bacteroidales bacterium MSK.15.36]MBE6063827.1 alkaline phosphatase [Clostridium cochlearium]MCG4572219.1 alkaline phosphatase [Clostridium cochlearium]MCR1971895.1 alkaline phosphatase [Clostridium cochlearium]NME95222.1 alkaline phosphatase [Clostridium cochlearium]